MEKVIIHYATAGTLESSDAFVTVEPHDDNGLEIAIDSVVQNQFGEQIYKAVQEVLDEQGIVSARVSVVDRGALDCVIRARVETAVLRGKGDME
ncbi:MAG: citrate lyase acyl carrier protein [Clostridia bacterium]|nr:citrate lyase acyl carrier protein [Clostridia bacterium]